MLLNAKHVTRRVERAAVRRVAILSGHASPLHAPASVHSGDQHAYVAYVAHLARELGQAGYLVDIFTRRDSMLHKQVVDWRENVRVIHVPAGPAHHIPKENLAPYMDAFAHFVIRFARRQEALYDVAHACCDMAGLAARQLKQELGIAFVNTRVSTSVSTSVSTFHAPSPIRPAHGANDAFANDHIRMKHALMRKCPPERPAIDKLVDAPAGQIDLAPCGFDPMQLWPMPVRLARQKLSLPMNKFVLLQLGPMVPREGIDTVIHSLALLRRQYGADAMLLVVSAESAPSVPGRYPGPPELTRLRERARELGVAEHVRFCVRNDRAELRYYYSACDVFVNTPWYAPSGVAPVEAMACSRPVIGAEVGGIKNIVIDGATGFLVPARDPHAVADRLALLHASADLAHNMGDAGMRRAFQHYTWRAVAQQAAAMYDTAIRQCAVCTQ